MKAKLPDPGLTIDDILGATLEHVGHRALVDEVVSCLWRMHPRVRARMVLELMLHHIADGIPWPTDPPTDSGEFDFSF